MTKTSLALPGSAKKAFGIGVVVVALVIFGLCSNALADTQTISLNIANANLSTQGAGPYASVVISDSVTNMATTTFTVTATGDNSFVFGDHSILDLNLSSSAGTGTLTQSSCVFTLAKGGTVTGATACSQGSSGNVDSFGNFNFVVDDGSGFSTGGYTILSFTFTTSTAVTLANLLTSNSTAEVAAHMALSTNTACTGYAGNAGTQGQGGPSDSSCTVAATEPGAVTLLGSGLLGVAVVLGRRGVNTF
jgi:hypothetical protein